ncbi:G-type lectin S-receptor-like serine/threonine-protein kinase [Morus notabilis]|uniref:G-type lectin S-receptor-like serine/threonine-protein kinase n=1 Tax=Morus notabilis TaxID=981085 RepID=W9QX84_9ROSA|nr:G-type lectin S-receptor-like serine/threonine-protein kinase [Morus notabilis]
MASKVVVTFIFLILCFPLGIQSSTSNSWIKAGYYTSQTELPVSDINSALFNHLIFAFAYVNSSSYELSINSSDSGKFSTFTNLVKRKNPSVATILSIWVGREQSSIFFSKLSQLSNRKSFIESSISVARINGFDGLDLCGIEPSTSLNMTVFGTLLEEWRVATDSEVKTKNKPRLLLVMLAHPRPSLHSVSYPIDAMKNNLDWVHIKSYDCSMPTKTNITFPQAALYDPSNQGINTNNSLQEWLDRGFPPSKLVLGLPYHGYAWTLVDPKDDPIGAFASGPAVTADGSMAYRFIKWFIRSYGYGADSIYNDTYVVNFCRIGKNWINYDDVEAIRAKVSYAKKMGLLGYNVFQVGNDDDNWALSRAGIRKVLKSTLYRTITGSDARDLNSNTPTKVLSYASIKVATNNFSSQNKLGEGGYGPVYKGKFANGQEMAVKRLSKTSNQGIEEFKNEVTLTANLQHVNLVRVLGYCTEKEEKMLIYEYMPKKSLDFYLFDPARRHILDWQKRVNIIEGITQGLLYLQEYSNFTVIHRDLKASNILLDDEMNPKISDFGMARIFRKEEHEANTDRIVGTLFGVTLLQIISGRRNTCLYGLNENLNLLEYAYELWKEGQGVQFIESTLDDSSSTCKILRCMQIALLCVQENPIDRPSMLAVSSMLKSEADAIVTPKKPAFSIKEEDGEHCKLKVRDETCSFNDSTISQVVPRS